MQKSVIVSIIETTDMCILLYDKAKNFIVECKKNIFSSSIDTIVLYIIGS